MVLVDDIARHGGIDLAGQLDELGGHAVLAGLPGQVERVDRDAVAAQARAGIERHGSRTAWSLAALMTSQTSMPMRSKSILSSLTIAILMQR